MSNWLRSSHASETCRLSWRPSRWLAALLVVMGVLGAAATLASAMPAGMAWPLAAASLLYGVCAAANQRRQAVRAVVWDGHAGLVHVDGAVVEDARVDWRGPLARLSWRGRHGRRQGLLFWPDVLHAAQRRELRLAAGSAAASPARPSMAP